MAFRVMLPCRLGTAVLFLALFQARWAAAEYLDTSDMDEIASQMKLAQQRGASYLEKKRAESIVDTRALGADYSSLHVDAERASSLMQSTTRMSRGVFQSSPPHGSAKMQPQGDFNPFKPDPVLQAWRN
mmetsp:Transcript_38318/g.105539  ORF Transcript_38318/g.105539 Transcript_38318/m.105539 type:complete len:129 (+) Transcript_38318:85-471(+)